MVYQAIESILFGAEHCASIGDVSKDGRPRPRSNRGLFGAEDSM